MTRRKKEWLGTAVRILIGIVYALPVILCVLFSFQPNSELNLMKLHFLPDRPTVENYAHVFTAIPFFTYFKNTFIQILITIPVQLTISLISAFTFSFYDFKGKGLLFTIVITTMMIPGETTLVAKFMMIHSMGLMNTYLGLTIVSFAEAGGIFILRQSMLSIPQEMWEASVLDGCGDMRYFLRIVIPLCKSTLMCQAVVSFIGTFNSYIWPFMVSSKDKFYTLQVGMFYLTNDMGMMPGYVLAGAVVCMTIPLLIYIFMQKSVVTGMTAGAVKN